MATKKEAKKKVVEKEMQVPPLNLKKIRVAISGKTPLVMDRFPPEVAAKILKKQLGQAKATKELRDTAKEVKEAIHTCANGKPGFPAGGFKAGMIESTSFIGDKMFSKKLLRGVQITNVDNGLIPITYKKQDVLQHQIEHNTKFSPQFHEWSCVLEIEYDANNISDYDLVALLNYSGHYYGIGSWSPRSKCGGSFGMYEVKKGKA